MKSRILVINSLDNFPTQPPPSTPYIKGLLKHSGVDSTQIDINVETWEEILTHNFFRNLKYNNPHKEYSDLFNLPELTESQFKEIQENILVNLKTIKYIYRNDSFYDLTKLSWANKKIEEIKTIFFYGTGYILNRYDTTFSLNPGMHLSINSTVSFSMDSSNPLRNIFSNIFKRIIKESTPKIAFIEVMWPWQIPEMATLANVLKCIHPDIHICFSGHGFDQVVFARLIPTLKNNPKSFNNFDSIFVVRNDDALVKLTNLQTINSDTLSTIPSLAFYSNGKTIISGPYIESHSNERIIPCYSDLKLKSYFSPRTVVIDRFSSGCFWASCSYCAINKNKRKNYSLSEEFYVSKLNTFWEKHGISHLFLLDEAAKPSQARTISNAINKSGKKFTWSLRTRISKGYDHELLKKMYDSGCRELWIGLESTSTDILRIMNKTPTPEKYLSNLSNIVQSCSKIGIGLHFCILFGFPGETNTDKEKVHDFFNAHAEHFKNVTTFISFNEFLLSPGSDVHQTPDRYRISIDDISDDRYLMDDIPFTYLDKIEQDNNSFGNTEQIVKEISNILCPNKYLSGIWHNSTDSCHELLLKEKYTRSNPFMRGASLEKYQIDIVTSSYILKHWESISSLIEKSFNNSSFNTGFTKSTPIAETYELINNDSEHKHSHVIARNEKGLIVGALFAIPYSNPDNDKKCDLGWFFTSPNIKHKDRIRLGKYIVEFAHEALRSANYKQVVTEMGTKEGERFLRKIHSYMPLAGSPQPNKWIKDLF